MGLGSVDFQLKTLSALRKVAPSDELRCSPVGPHPTARPSSALASKSLRRGLGNALDELTSDAMVAWAEMRVQ